MTYRDESNQSKSEFMSVGKAVESVTGRRINPSTIWRWIKQGVAGIAGERIRLECWPMGRSVLTTEQAVRDFIEKQKQAREASQMQRESNEVTEEELRQAGLLRPERPKPTKWRQDRL